MKCVIYKSSKRDQLYLFLPQVDRFDPVPPELLASFGRPQFVMELDLIPGRTLARSDPQEVRKNLQEKGYHLQLPPADPLRGERAV